MLSILSLEEVDRFFDDIDLKYQVSTGDLGAVYCGYDKRMEQNVAVKVFPRHFSDDEETKRMFYLEASVLLSLEHKHLVRVYDFGEIGGYLWMSMEWVEGKTLKQLADGGELDFQELMVLFKQVCSALDCAHSAGVIHRDIRPSNIMLNNEGVVKLVNFEFIFSEEVFHKAREGAPWNAMSYASPEILNAQEVVDHRADIFSLGVLLYELVTGRLPSGEFRAPTEINHDLNPRFNEIILYSMQENPDRRFQSCDDLSQSLRAV